MVFWVKNAYQRGENTAFDTFGLTKEAGVGARIVQGLKWGGRAASNLPGVGALASAPAQGLAGVAQGFMQGEGLKGALTRGAIGAGTGMIAAPGVGMAASIGGDMLANKLLAPKPVQGPAVGPMPGMMGQTHLPGMVG